MKPCLDEGPSLADPDPVAIALTELLGRFGTRHHQGDGAQQGRFPGTVSACQNRPAGRAPLRTSQVQLDAGETAYGVDGKAIDVQSSLLCAQFKAARQRYVSSSRSPNQGADAAGPEIERIVDLQSEDLRRRLTDRGVRLELTEPARQFVARTGYDPVYGARPLKRFLQHELESKIARALIGGQVVEGSIVKVDVKGGALAVEIEVPKPKEAEVAVGV